MDIFLINKFGKEYIPKEKEMKAEGSMERNMIDMTGSTTKIKKQLLNDRSVEHIKKKIEHKGSDRLNLMNY